MNTDTAGCKPLNNNGCISPDAVFAERRKALRREKLAARRLLSPEERQSADSRIADRLIPLLTSTAYDTLAGYMTDGTEPDLKPVLQYALSQGKTICLPRFKDAEHYDMTVVRSLEQFPNQVFGIPEPDSSAQVAADEQLKNAVWLIPGVVFDPACNRLGRGKGVYDRLLERQQPKLAIGIFYECQKCGKVPVMNHDRPLDVIITEDCCYMASSK